MAKSTPYQSLRIARGFKNLIALRGWTKRKFAEVAGIFPQDVNKYLAAELNPENLLLALYEAGEDIEWIKSGGSTSRFAVHERSAGEGSTAPLLGRIVISPEGEEVTETVGIPVTAGVPFFKGNFFCLEIGNDSMIDADPPIFPGDLCIFEAERKPKKGAIVALHCADNRRIVKILTHASRTELTLSAANKFRQFPGMKIKKSTLLGTGTFVMKLQLSDEAKRRFGLLE